jgi:replicative DNA helicase
MAVELQHQMIVDRSALTLGDMSVHIQAYDEYFGRRPHVVIIDYLELIGGGKSSGEGWQRTEAIAGSLKDWAKDERLPVFVLHQTNRYEPEWKAPNADSARGAGFVEADLVVGLWAPWKDPDLGQAERQQLSDQIWFNVLKNRVSGKVTQAPIRTRLKDNLRIVDLSVAELGREVA